LKQQINFKIVLKIKEKIMNKRVMKKSKEREKEEDLRFSENYLLINEAMNWKSKP